ncbi:MAG: aminomethyl-transferring glycine dehydrogenase subunit GcvPB [Fimbriimonadaceae bacterium]
MPQKTVPAPKLIFDRSRPGRVGCNVPTCDTPQVDLKDCLGDLRDELHLPEVDELTLLRHFTNLSHINYGIETGFYPLGSCTMKYNPKINERTAALPGFSHIHPMQPESTVPGALEVLASVQDILREVAGFDEICLQPMAGAHGEMTCLMMIKAYHHANKEGDQRHTVLVPDSAHGTNPASAARCGYDVLSIPTDIEGSIDIEALRQTLAEKGNTVAAFMITNPSTLGLFESRITEICAMIHEAGGQVFCDGANMNAMVGTTRPGDHGFDCMHLNLHKTFSTPHGGGGPGCGAIGVQRHLGPFLPAPVIRRSPSSPTPTSRETDRGNSKKPAAETGEGAPYFDHDRPLSIGRVSGYHGQFLMEVRALTYLLAYGKERMADISRHAVLNANYVRARIKDVLPPAHPRPCMHEVVVTAQQYKKNGVRALDISKRLIDYGFHPPTNYFPLIVPECLMIEPTETETKETLDEFCDALISICREAIEDPDALHDAPTTQIVGRLDETKAVKDLDVAWKPVLEPALA